MRRKKHQPVITFLRSRAYSGLLPQCMVRDWHSVDSGRDYVDPVCFTIDELGLRNTVPRDIPGYVKLTAQPPATDNIALTEGEKSSYIPLSHHDFPDSQLLGYTEDQGYVRLTHHPTRVTEEEVLGLLSDGRFYSALRATGMTRQDFWVENDIGLFTLYQLTGANSIDSLARHFGRTTEEIAEWIACMPPELPNEVYEVA